MQTTRSIGESLYGAPRRRHRSPTRRAGAGCRPRRLALVFLVFFVMPLVLVVIVSFWDYNDYEMLPAFTTRSYTENFEGCLTSCPISARS